MRLLECALNDDGERLNIRLTEYGGVETPEYAILSHRWRDEEVQYEDILSGKDYTSMQGYKKIEGCARAALQYGIRYIWIDTYVAAEDTLLDHPKLILVKLPDAVSIKAAALSFRRRSTACTPGTTIA